MKKEPTIIIVCFAYNCENYIAQTVESVINQTYKNYKFVLYENGSTDNTRKILERYKNHPNIIYQELDYNNINYPGKCEIKNYYELIEVNDEDYFTTLDSDDYLEPDALECMVKLAVEHDADVVLAGCNMFLDRNGQIVSIRKPAKTKFYKNIKDIVEDWANVYGSLRVRWGNIYRYSLFKKSGEFLNNKFKLVNGSDTLQNILLLGMTKNAVALDKPVINFRIREKSLYNSRIAPERYKAYDVICEETYKLFQKWQVDDIRLYYITEAIREGAIIELVRNTALSKENFDNNTELLNNIFRNEKFVSAIRKFGLDKEFFEEVIGAFGKEDYLNEYEAYHFISCPALILTEAVVKSKINIGLYLAGLYHENNSNMLGISKAEEIFSCLNSDIKQSFGNCDFKKMLANKKQIFNLLTGNYLEASRGIDGVDLNSLEDYMLNKEDECVKQMLSLKQDVETLLERGQNAEKPVREIFDIWPLDKDGIKYLLINSSNMEDPIGLAEGILLTKTFYCENVDLLYLSALACGQLGMYTMALEFLNIALPKCETNEQIEVLETEIANFRSLIQGGQHE